MSLSRGWLSVHQWLRGAFTWHPTQRVRASTKRPGQTVPLSSIRIRVQSAEQLLAAPERQAHVQAIEDLTRVTPVHFEVLYRQALRNYAAFVQQLPASEAHHHAGLGGLLDHGLEASVFALKLRRAHLLPPGAPTEVIDEQADLWSYACFTAVLLHDIGKPAVDHEVILFDKYGQPIGPWDPWAGPIQAFSYEARFLRGRDYRLHLKAAPLLARFIVPPEGLCWLTSEREVLAAWLAAITGMPEGTGPLGQIVEEADRLSAAQDLIGGATPQAPTSRMRPLHERLVTGLRYLIDRGELPLNRPGATGWLMQDTLWLVVKTALDALRAHLLQEGQSGIPSDNRRLMDELQQRGMLIPNGDRAVWRARILLPDWQQELTLLRLPAVRLWPNPEARPAACPGTVEPVSEPGSTEAPRTRLEASTAVSTTPPIEAPLPEVGDQKHSSLLKDGYFPVSFPRAPMPALIPEPLIESFDEVEDDRASPPARVALETLAETGNEAALPTQSPHDLGQAFLAWLRTGLASGQLPINTVNARVHRVIEGLFLVSPGIFRDYATAVNAPWDSVQKRFQKLRHHRRTPTGMNIWTYTVVGGRRTRKLKGIVIEDPETVLGPRVTLPPPNPHVLLVHGPKE